LDKIDYKTLPDSLQKKNKAELEAIVNQKAPKEPASKKRYWI
jgi:hypothetical protein